MTKHDTWVKLKPGNPYEPILEIFPNGTLPMRDPFPLERGIDAEGKNVPLWIIDIDRLSITQARALAQLIASAKGAGVDEVATDAATKGGFAMADGWVESMHCDAEGFQRSKELADFFETAPHPPSKKAWRNFYNSQHERWIEGNEQPKSIYSIEDVDPRLRTPELEQAFFKRKIEGALAAGNYSVLDVLTGRAMVDVLNQVDPKNSWSLVGDYDEDWYE
ncbi:hypothetical protein [Nostoc sp. MG11]|uniref:hypothetical protein n=1 Tax=Nostoc sp. MG11 TaxID=2721166 RepID=UPI001866F707|nr:hypothetical protein [Nostoc sp. MG11]